MSLKIEMLTQEVARQLKQIGATLATAESCTGGGLSYYLTSIPGSSDWFDRGFVTYSNIAKMDMLGVPETLIAQHGAVSKEVAVAMAEGALSHSTATIAIAITGIAGPSGGTPEKPVGTVWITVLSKGSEPNTVLNVFTGNRQAIRIKSIEQALQMLAIMTIPPF